MRKKYYSAQTRKARKAAFKKSVRLNLAFFALGMGLTVVFIIKTGCLPADFLGFTIAAF